MLLKDVLVY